MSSEALRNARELEARYGPRTSPQADAIPFEADGQAIIDVEKYDLIFDDEPEG